VRARRTPPGLSVFPFLSVLLCATGTLLVVLVGTSLTAIGTTRQTFVVSIREARPRATGADWDRQPIYVVCDGSGLTVYRSADDVRRVPADVLDGPGGDGALLSLTDALARLRQESWPVLFVKPSGLAYMQRLYARLEDRQVRVGKWAFAEDSRIVAEAAAPSRRGTR
jgi:hypothetical protein